MIESVGFQGNCQGKNGVYVAKSMFRCHERNTTIKEGRTHRLFRLLLPKGKKLSGKGEEFNPSEHRKQGRPTS